MKRVLMAGVLIGMIMLVSLTPQVYAASNNNQAIIVKGEDSSAFRGDANHAYDELNQSRNLSAADIQYLDGNTTDPRVDAIANKTNLNKSITDWAKNNCTSGGKLTIYISSHGGDNGTPNDTTDDYLRIGPDRVTGAELKAWIDEFHNACPDSELVIVIDACHSGSFIDDLSAPNTTVITASEACKPAYYYECNYSIFSQPFWSKITDNATLTEAFTYASAVVSADNKKYPGETPQIPLYDDNNDGVGHSAPLPNGGDGDRTKDLKIGVNVSVNQRPVIENRTPDQSVAPGTSMVLNVTATDDVAVTRVYGFVFPPDFVITAPPALEPEGIEFTNAGGDLWQCNYTFNKTGDYYMMLHAEDNEPSLSYGESIHISVGGVGGIVELPQIEEPGTAIPDLSEHNYGALAGIIVGAIVGVIMLISAVWYIRRRRTKAI